MRLESSMFVRNQVQLMGAAFSDLAFRIYTGNTGVGAAGSKSPGAFTHVIPVWFVGPVDDGVAATGQTRLPNARDGSVRASDLNPSALFYRGVFDCSPLWSRSIKCARLCLAVLASLACVQMALDVFVPRVIYVKTTATSCVVNSLFMGMKNMVTCTTRMSQSMHRYSDYLLDDIVYGMVL
jgi:hypothetical protein